MTTPSQPVLRRYGFDEASDLTLVCIPYAGGSANVFRTWAEPLARVGVNLTAVHPPGRGDRILEPPHRSIDGLVEEVAVEFDGATGGRYALLGHSMGAVVGLKLVHRIEQAGGNPPERLIVGAHHPPGFGEDPLRDRWKLDDDQFLDTLKPLGGLPDELFTSPELLELVLPALRADFQALAECRWAGDVRVRCPLIAYGGVDDELIPFTDIAEWETCAAAEFRAVPLPGGHFAPWEDEPAFLSQLCRMLGRAPDDRAPRETTRARPVESQ